MVNKRENRGQIQGKRDLVRDGAKFEISKFKISGVDCISSYFGNSTYLRETRSLAHV